MMWEAQNFSKLLVPVMRKAFEDQYRVRDFDREDLPPITECPDCGYDGEGLWEQLREINIQIEQFNLGNIDSVDCLCAISEIFREGAK